MVSHPSLLTRIPLALAAVLFVVYPALRPYSSETGLAGARAFASWEWTAAHLCGVVGFVLLAQVIGRFGLGRVGPTMVSLGAMLVLPYYGAEVFGVAAIGQRALDRGDPGLVSLVDHIRFSGPAATLFATGLLLLTIGGVTVGVTLWRRSAPTAGVLIGLGLAAYLPQFYLPPTGRIIHGVVLGAGLLLLAARTPESETLAR